MLSVSSSGCDPEPTVVNGEVGSKASSIIIKTLNRILYFEAVDR